VIKIAFDKKALANARAFSFVLERISDAFRALLLGTFHKPPRGRHLAGRHSQL